MISGCEVGEGTSFPEVEAEIPGSEVEAVSSRPLVEALLYRPVVEAEIPGSEVEAVSSGLW